MPRWHGDAAPLVREVAFERQAHSTKGVRWAIPPDSSNGKAYGPHRTQRSRQGCSSFHRPGRWKRFWSWMNGLSAFTSDGSRPNRILQAFRAHSPLFDSRYSMCAPTQSTDFVSASPMVGKLVWNPWIPVRSQQEWLSHKLAVSTQDKSGMLLLWGADCFCVYVGLFWWLADIRTNSESQSPKTQD